MAHVHDIRIKKKFGQHFLRDHTVIQTMIDSVHIDPTTSIFEIGCGDGFLTREILETPAARLWVFEIDPEWAAHVRTELPDERLVMNQEDFLAADLTRLKDNAPWTILANLPYQVTFPILHRFQEYRYLLKEGVVMVQEEVAQKIVQASGRGFGYPALFFQQYFDWQLLTKIPPTAFFPPPKVTSRLLYFKPRTNAPVIPDEENFWRFIKKCFAQPRRMFKNNMAGTIYDSNRIPERYFDLRAQQMTMNDFLLIWDLVRK